MLFRSLNPITLPLFFPDAAKGRSLRTVDYNLQQPHILDYHVTVEKQLPGQIGVTVAYAGSRGLNIMQTKDGNPTIPTIMPDGRQFWPAGARRNSLLWEGMELKTAGGNSWYNSLQLSVNQRLSRGFQLQSSYTYAKVIDDTQGQAGADNAGSSIFGLNPSRRSTDRAVADFDTTQNWRINTIYSLPKFAEGGIVGGLVNGWRLSNILSLQTGYPFTPALNTNRSRNVVNTGGGGIDRPDLVAGRTRSDIIRGGINGYFDGKAFTLPEPGYIGNAGRNILRGPGLANLDFSVTKETAISKLGESGRLEFRVEVFNILNRVNLGMPNRTVFTGNSVPPATEQPLATAGIINNTATTSRQMQFALKLYF